MRADESQEHRNALELRRVAQETGELAGDDGDGAPRHEPRHGRRGDELDEPSETEQADGEDDESGDEGEGGCDDRASKDLSSWLPLDVRDDLGDLEGHDSDGTDGDILGGRKDGVDDD